MSGKGGPSSDERGGPAFVALWAAFEGSNGFNYILLLIARRIIEKFVI